MTHNTEKPLHHQQTFLYDKNEQSLEFKFILIEKKTESKIYVFRIDLRGLKDLNDLLIRIFSKVGTEIFVDRYSDLVIQYFENYVTILKKIKEDYDIHMFFTEIQEKLKGGKTFRFYLEIKCFKHHMKFMSANESKVCS